MASKEKFQKAKKIFRKHQGILRTKDALELGVHPKTLYSMREEGVIEPLSRGLYRLQESPDISQIDLIIVSKKIPNGVICLVSALSFHEVTTQIPHKVDIAIPIKAHQPNLDYPPTQFYWYSEKMHSSGVETHQIEGIEVKIYSIEKTLADCFKYRNKIGLDIALEALRFYWQTKKTNIKKLLEYAKICRCEKIITPYLEAIAHE